MKDYEIELLVLLDNTDMRFNQMAALKTVALYREYSNQHYARWITVTEKVIGSFCEWCFNSPFELINKE